MTGKVRPMFVAIAVTALLLLLSLATADLLISQTSAEDLEQMGLEH